MSRKEPQEIPKGLIKPPPPPAPPDRLVKEGGGERREYPKKARQCYGCIFIGGDKCKPIYMEGDNGNWCSDC